MIKQLNFILGSTFNKKQKVIAAILAYYRGSITKFPYNENDIAETKKWLMNGGYVYNKEEVLERLTIMEAMVKNNKVNLV